MTGWTIHQGIAAPMLEDNVNTDAIIPSKEMKRVSKAGMAEGLFANLRYEGDRDPVAEFVLNRSPFGNASILLTGSNFGCGSSREHAVWALKDYGFRAIIAEAFGGIFFDNCMANGVVPVGLPKDYISEIAEWCETDPEARKPLINLDKMVVCTERSYSFQLPEAGHHMITTGQSPIDLTLAHKNAIDMFAQKDKATRPWLYHPAQMASPGKTISRATSSNEHKMNGIADR